MENQFGTVQLEARRQCRAVLGWDLLEAQDLAAAVAVEMGVAVRMAVLATIVRNVQLRNVEAGRRAG